MPKRTTIIFEADDRKEGMTPAEILAALNEVDDGLLDTNWRVKVVTGMKSQVKELHFIDISKTLPEEFQK